jgi:hypothetical protein
VKPTPSPSGPPPPCRFLESFARSQRPILQRLFFDAVEAGRATPPGVLAHVRDAAYRQSAPGRAGGARDEQSAFFARVIESTMTDRRAWEFALGAIRQQHQQRAKGGPAR